MDAERRPARFDVHVEHLILHGPLTGSRGDHQAAIEREIARVLTEHGPAGLAELRLDGSRNRPAARTRNERRTAAS